MILTQVRVKELFNYDTITGVLRWKISLSNRAKAGTKAGHKDVRKSNAYLQVRIEGRIWYAHVIIWVWMTGKMPVFEVDHKDRHGLNNVWDNLQDVTHRVNMLNTLEHETIREAKRATEIRV